MNWRAKKQISYFLIVFFSIAIIIFLVVFFRAPEPTCFDNKQNQKEEGVDCGGPCKPCVVKPKDAITLWTRVFQTNEGIYEAASLIENPNLFYGLPLFKYTFRLYDSNNILAAIKEGQSFLNPHDKFVIFIPNIETGQRNAVRAFMEIEYTLPWQYVEEEKSSLLVSEKNFSNFPFPTLSAYLFNQSLFPAKDVGVAAVLYDQDANAIAVSSSKLDFIQQENGRSVVFTWPIPFAAEPASSEIFARINLMAK